jgi:tRNA-Thr(GGU) m(6)t(6)A37 methyltransferase TsaA
LRSKTESAARPAIVSFEPIGIIRTPFLASEGMPIQAVVADGAAGTVEIDTRFQEGLADLDGFSHLILLYHLHRVRGARLTVTPYLDDRPHGIFATRSPARPNAIGLSTVRLVGVRGATIDILDVDMLDGTPLLDIKPYVPELDDRRATKIGWFSDRLERLADTIADSRFRA